MAGGEQQASTKAPRGLIRAFLRTVSGHRIELFPNRVYVLGRSSDCDLPSEDMACSRRHAKIVAAGAPHVLYLEDSGSKNGTYRNDDRIEGRVQLAHGDRVRIGNTIYQVHFHLEGADGVDLSETGTIAFESVDMQDTRVHKLPGAGIPGASDDTQIAGQFDSLDVVGELERRVRSGVTGTLHLACPDGLAKVEIHRGEVLSACYGDHTGVRALVELVHRKTGLVWMTDELERSGRNVEMEMDELLAGLRETQEESTSN